MNRQIHLLLQLIKENADTSFLLKQGLTFSQISLLFAEAIKDELIAQSDNSFTVTEKGLEHLQSQKDVRKYGAKGNWIFPDESYTIPAISPDQIYLPKLKQSKFLET